MDTDIRRVAVVGAGTMGHGIAQVSAQAGAVVTLIDATSELAERGRARVLENLEEGVKRSKVTPDTRDAVMSRIGCADSVSAARDADLIVEAVPEKIELKHALFDALKSVASDTAMIASNTSSLSISDLQRHVSNPTRFIGLHFFNPVHINKLVEVIHGEQTSKETLERAVAFVRRIEKEPVVVKDSPGFATSRLGVLLGLEAMRMLEEGVATAEDIDKALELGYRHPMGPLKLTDLVGLDVRLDIARYLHEKLGAEHFRPPRILEQMVSEGRLGKKSGQGFYQW